MSNLINSSDIKSKISGKMGSFFSRKTSISIGLTDKFIYQEFSKGKNSETVIFPLSRIDSYGIALSQSRLFLILGIITLPIIIGLVFLIIWMMSRKLVFTVNTISKETLGIELQNTNTEEIEEFIKLLNQKF
tara:strand:+ start:45 stop:440 length:396 start_codon:yes stop_codon:yes gene_type:complete